MTEYRIVKLANRPIDHRMYDGKIDREYYDMDFYVVEYRNRPSIWNLWRPRWKRVTYNMERYLRSPYTWSWNRVYICTSDGIYNVGSYIPGQENAKKLLDEFKTKYETNEKHGGSVDIEDRVVYSELDKHREGIDIRKDLDKLLAKKK